MINLIIAREEHLAHIQAIAHGTWYTAYSGIVSDEQLKFMLNMMYSTNALKSQIYEKNHVYLLVEENENYIGYASYELNYENTGKVKIHKIYVLPDCQQKGAGRLLINKIEQIARAAGSDSIVLDMNKQNPSISFYNKIGFTIIAEKCAEIGHGYVMDDYILEKSI